MSDWVRRNLSRGLEWSDGLTKIRVSYSHSGVDVRVFPDGQTQLSIPLLTNSGFDHIHICDLQGAGANTEWHDKKYGTLLVNLLIQAYKLLFPEEEHASVRVFGETHCDLGKDDPGVIENCKRRSHFWSRFGLKVDHPESRKSAMECTLADLTIVEREVYPGLVTSLSLEEFNLEVHAPIFLEGDMDKLRRISISEHDVERVVKANKEITEFRESMYKEFQYASVFSSLSLAFFLVTLYPEESLIAKALAFIGIGFVGYFALLRYTPTSWVHFMPSAFSLSRAEKEKLNAREYIESLLETVFDGDCRFIGRVYSALKHRIPDLPKNDSFDCIAYGAERGNIDKRDALTLAGMILSINESLKKLNKVNEEVTKDDFLFGDVSSMSVRDLSFYYSRLGPQFRQQINRLLNRRSKNHLCITGTPDDSIDDILVALKEDIAQVVVYASDTADDIKRVGLKLYLGSGVLDFSHVWCTWKEQYFEYLLKAFLPFFTTKLNCEDLLISKVYISWSSTTYIRPKDAGLEINDFAKEIADISGSRFSDAFIESCAAKQLENIKSKNLKASGQPA